MGTIRFFSGARDSNAKASYATQMMRNQILKRGKLTPAERFKKITKQKMEENRNKLKVSLKPFALPGAQVMSRGMSKRAEQALKDIAKKKAAKRAKAERRSVIVTPRNYATGSLVRNGAIYDIAGNNVAKVNRKNGKILVTTGFGGFIGMYKPQSMQTHLIIQDAINRYSPHFINLRKMQDMQQGHGVWGAPADHAVLNIYGRSGAGQDHSDHHHGDSGVYGDYSSDMAGPRQNVGSTSWGAMSDNVWGTFNDNVWGTSTDTVWGTNTSDIWGGIGGNPWGEGRTHRIWGSGSGHNYMKGLAARVAAFFGLHLKSQASRAAFHEAVSVVRNSRTAGGHEHGVTTRASSHDAHEHAQTTRASSGADHHAQAGTTTRAAAPAPTARK